MIFTIDARLSLKFEIWRLQKDHTWRPLEQDHRINEKIDWTTTDVSYTKPYCQSNIEVTIDSKTYEANPSEHLIGSELVTVKTIVHRLTKPHRFTIEELKEVIRNGDDRKRNVLIIDLKGYFSLVDFFPGIIHDPEIAVRHEAFIAGIGFVGKDAAQHETFIRQVFVYMLNGWVMHLKTGEVNIFMDLYPDKKENDLLEEVEKLTASLE